MSDYYFDIETFSKTPKPDFNNDEIIAISYQQIDSRTGVPKGNLNILKSWESSESEILKQFYNILNLKNKWGFIPIGFNIASFDLMSLGCRWRKNGIEVNATSLYANHPFIDIYPIIFLCNNGEFLGCTLEKFAGKQDSGSKVNEWYTCKDYSAIQSYIEDEATCFLNLYQFLVQRLPGLWLEFGREQK